MKLKYQVVISDTSGRAIVDSASPNPAIKMWVEFRGKNFEVGVFTLAEIRMLTGGTSTAYRALEAETTSTGVPAIITDLTNDNEKFTDWAKKFPNSILTPFLSEMHKP